MSHEIFYIQSYEFFYGNRYKNASVCMKIYATNTIHAKI